MKRPTADMFHDEVFHEGMRKLAFLVSLAMAIGVLHRVIYHVVLAW